MNNYEAYKAELLEVGWTLGEIESMWQKYVTPADERLIGERVAEAQRILSIAQDSPNPNKAKLEKAALIFEAAIESPLVSEEDKPDLILECAVAWAMYGDFAKAESLAKAVMPRLIITPPLAAILGTVAPGLIPKLLPSATGFYHYYLLLLTDELATSAQKRQALNDCLIASLDDGSSFENGILRSCRVCLRSQKPTN
jgi:hypothetical protein